MCLLGLNALINLHAILVKVVGPVDVGLFGRHRNRCTFDEPHVWILLCVTMKRIMAKGYIGGKLAEIGLRALISEWMCKSASTTAPAAYYLSRGGGLFTRGD